MPDITIYKTVQRPGISDKRIHTIIANVISKVGKKGQCISIHLIGDYKMRNLNRVYRGKDRTTDVLSFSAQEGEMIFDEHDLGDLFISIPQIRRQAKRFDISFAEECTRMLVHGTLHLLGYDHIKKADAKVMFALQEMIVEELV